MESKIAHELKRIAEIHNGLLRPDVVVEYARDENSPLHRSFTWDDTAAARAHRLWQARQLISAQVTIIPSTNKEIDAFVSLDSDRRNGGGYRMIVEVMSDEVRRAELLRQAAREARAWARKYQDVRELSNVRGHVEAFAQSVGA
jgi:hypothetical protein